MSFVPGATAEPVYPSVRSAPAPTTVGEPSVVAPTQGPPAAPGRPTPPPTTTAIPDRAALRGDAGEAVGTVDRPRTGRGIARSPAGEAVGTVDPSRSGGGVVRGPDGSVRGIVPAAPSARGSGLAPRR